MYLAVRCMPAFLSYVNGMAGLWLMPSFQTSEIPSEVRWVILCLSPWFCHVGSCFFRMVCPAGVCGYFLGFGVR